MTAPDLHNSIRSRREAMALSQLTLAKRVGVSRQALIAIEAGRQVPSTTLTLLLARSLRCRVEELFELIPSDTLDVAMAPSSVHSKQLTDARLVLGRVGGRWVGHDVGSAAGVAADALVDSVSGQKASVEPLTDVDTLQNKVLLAGCAPLLGLLAAGATRRYHDAPMAWLAANNERSLHLLRDGYVHVAGLHLDDDAGKGDAGKGDARKVTAVVQRVVPGRALALVHLTRWRQGLVVAKHNPLALREVGDLLQPEVRVARREPGSGADNLLRRLMEAAGAATEPLSGNLLARGHDEVAQLVHHGAADVGIAIESVARAAELDFVPLVEERFDLVLPAELLQEQPVQRLLDMLNGREFRREIATLPGYDASDCGSAIVLKASATETAR